VFERIPPVCAAGARVLLLGIFHHETRLMPAPLVRRELRYEGSFCYNWTDFEHSLELIRRGQVVTQHVVTHTLPLSEIGWALDLIHRQQAVKIILEP
jgi:threonine dehydrogenase-like Zn-dependent dehydrogenase